MGLGVVIGMGIGGRSCWIGCIDVLSVGGVDCKWYRIECMEEGLVVLIWGTGEGGEVALLSIR